MVKNRKDWPRKTWNISVAEIIKRKGKKLKQSQGVKRNDEFFLENRKEKLRTSTPTGKSGRIYDYVVKAPSSKGSSFFGKQFSIKRFTLNRRKYIHRIRCFRLSVEFLNTLWMAK